MDLKEMAKKIGWVLVVWIVVSLVVFILSTDASSVGIGLVIALMWHFYRELKKSVPHQ